MTNKYYIRKLSIDGKSQTLLRQGFGFVAPLDVDLVDNKIYAVDLVKATTYRLNLNGTGDLEKIESSGMRGTQGICVDWIGRYASKDLDPIMGSDLTYIFTTLISVVGLYVTKVTNIVRPEI